VKMVLLVEDSLTLRDMVREYLEAHGLGVRVASNGQEALYACRHDPPDLVLLDVMMPHMDGLTFLRAYRASWHAPVILLTALDAERDKIAGLESGADDYVTKPFSLAELLARVRAQLRRADGPQGTSVLRHGPLTLDLDARSVRVSGEPVTLTRSEFELLAALMRSPGRVLSRPDLLACLQDDVSASERTIDVHVRNLRVKTEPDPGRPRWLETVFGVGYRLRPEAAR